MTFPATDRRIHDRKEREMADEFQLAFYKDAIHQVKRVFVEPRHRKSDRPKFVDAGLILTGALLASLLFAVMRFVA